MHSVIAFALDIWDRYERLSWGWFGRSAVRSILSAALLVSAYLTLALPRMPEGWIVPGWIAVLLVAFGLTRRARRLMQNASRTWDDRYVRDKRHKADPS